MFPLAVISDIHGNRWALEAVLEDIEKRWIADIVNLGDILYGPLDPSGTAELLMNYSIPTVYGNQDRILFDTPDPGNERLVQVRGQLSADQIEWLKTFPFSDCMCDVLLFHGTPSSDSEYLVYKVDEAGISFRSNDDYEMLLAEKEKKLFLCGHDHKPNIIQLNNGKTIINPGSVGLQAYDDDEPSFHIIENGSPHARYAIIDETENGYLAEFITVNYDYKTASEIAFKNGREDWAHWLKTGRVK